MCASRSLTDVHRGRDSVLQQEDELVQGVGLDEPEAGRALDHPGADQRQQYVSDGYHACYH